jgi:hypothetical protein
LHRGNINRVFSPGIFSALEKAFIVYPIATNFNRPYTRGPWAARWMRQSFYIGAYFVVCRFTDPKPHLTVYIRGKERSRHIGTISSSRAIVTSATRI